MIYPDFKKFQELSKTSKLVSLSLEIEGDTETPITLFKKLCRESNSYLLESVEGGNKWSRYSYIGRKPFMVIKAYGDELLISREGKVSRKKGKVLELVKELMEEFSMVHIEDMPDFIGGAVGYIGYDVIRNYEKLGEVNVDDIKMPDIHLLLTEEIICYDHLRQKIKIIINLPTDCDLYNEYEKGLSRLEEIKREIFEKELKVEDREEVHSEKREYSSNKSEEEFIQDVLKAKRYIKDGDIFQVVLSQRLEINTGIKPFKAYRTLRSINPSPYMFYVDFGEYHLVGSSPELLVKVKEGVVETCPIAGTRPRGKDSKEDERYAEELLGDEKERAEHLMLVDLGRNDIGKISKFGTVKVNQFMDIQKYSHVMHIVSNVIGEIKDSCDMYDALTACLPAGTVSGAPKVRAMEIIDELENRKRGLYAGGVGYLGFNGNMDMCIAIRTMIFKEGKAYIQAGAGIVADSNPKSEYEETLRKAKALMETIKVAEGERV